MPKSKMPTNIKFNDFEKISGKQGSNPGGFFKNKEGKEYYIKWLPEHLLDDEKKFFKTQDLNKGKYKNRHRNRFNNEVLAARIYELYGVSVSKIEFITFVDEDGVTNYGIASEKKDGITMIREAGKDFEQVRNKAQEDFLIDVLLSNYDVVGLTMNNLFYDSQTKEPFRLDPGAALRYRARGEAKKEEFNAKVGEYEDLAAGSQKNTKFNRSVLQSAGKVFNGVFDSPALLIGLRKLLSVTDKQLEDCVEINGFDIDDTGKGQKKNKALIGQLLQRKETLIKKAESTILDRLISGLKNTKVRDDYLTKAGISEIYRKQICDAINKKQRDQALKLIRAAITPIVIKQAEKTPVIGTIESKNEFDFSDEEAIFNQIIKDFLHPRCAQDSEIYPNLYKGNSKGPDQIQRIKHGGMHASRTLLHTDKIISLLHQSGYKPVAKLTSKDRFLIKVAAIFHDTGRGNDAGGDQQAWEKAGAEYAKKWLLERGFSQEDAEKVYEAVADKDKPEVQETNVYALVLAASDSLDWVRSHSSNFNADHMPSLIKQYIPKDTLNQLALVAKHIATAQGDSPLDYMDIKGNFNIATKKTYEHSLKGCYTAIKTAYKKFSSQLDQVKILKKEEVTSVSMSKHEEALLRDHIKKDIEPKKPPYKYPNEKGNLNPAFQNISEDHFHCPLQDNEKRIFALREDFILATGTKNSEINTGNKPFDVFSEQVQKQISDYLDPNDRYGHPSLAIPEGEYKGLVYGAGWLAQRNGYLQVFWVSGRFHQKLSPEKQALLESYLAKKFIDAYGDQKIRFYDYVGDNIDNGKPGFEEKRKFFNNEELPKLYREYDLNKIANLAQSLALLTAFDTAMNKLNKLQNALQDKYGNNPIKTPIIGANRRLISGLEKAKLAYKASGDQEAFKKYCTEAINKVKEQYNTHRDSDVKKILGDLSKAFIKLLAKLFLSTEKYKARTTSQEKAVKFFDNPKERLTRSAQILHDFNVDLEKAFDNIEVKSEDNEKDLGFS